MSDSRPRVRPLADVLNGPDAEVRAAMVIAQCTGFAILNQMLQPRALAEAQKEELVALLNESLAACIGRGPSNGCRARTLEYIEVTRRLRLPAQKVHC
jgi:hypothetical protein